jgi:hypothetical protein
MTIMIENSLNLVIPPELANFEKFQIVRINNDCLKFRTGLYRDCLAVFVVLEAEEVRGHFGVVSIKNQSSIAIGFVSCDMNMVAVEKPFFTWGYFETQIFNEVEVEFLGRIVGFCEPALDAKGKHEVKLIEIRPEPNEDEIPPLVFHPFPK